MISSRYTYLLPVRLAHRNFALPPKAELEEDMRVRATFEEAAEALTRPVTVRYISRPKWRPE